MREQGIGMVIGLALLAPTLGGCVGADMDPPVATIATPASPAGAPSMLEAAPARDADKEMALARDSYRERDYGLAEKHFRRAVELSSTRAEAWLGLAAADDRLGRFDLADREYAQVEKRVGPRLELLNNRGMSYMLRGDLARARRDFTAAAKLDPDDETVRENRRLLDEKAASTR